MAKRKRSKKNKASGSLSNVQNQNCNNILGSNADVTAKINSRTNSVSTTVLNYDDTDNNYNNNIDRDINLATTVSNGLRYSRERPSLDTLHFQTHSYPSPGNSNLGLQSSTQSPLPQSHTNNPSSKYLIQPSSNSNKESESPYSTLPSENLTPIFTEDRDTDEPKKKKQCIEKPILESGDENSSRYSNPPMSGTLDMNSNDNGNCEEDLEGDDYSEGSDNDNNINSNGNGNGNGKNNGKHTAGPLDVDSGQRAAFPIPKLSKYAKFSGPPKNVLEYLARVQQEATNRPSVVTTNRNHPVKPLEFGGRTLRSYDSSNNKINQILSSTSESSENSSNTILSPAPAHDGNIDPNKLKKNANEVKFSINRSRYFAIASQGEKEFLELQKDWHTKFLESFIQTRKMLSKRVLDLKNKPVPPFPTLCAPNIKTAILGQTGDGSNNTNNNNNNSTNTSVSSSSSSNPVATNFNEWKKFLTVESKISPSPSLLYYLDITFNFRLIDYACKCLSKNISGQLSKWIYALLLKLPDTLEADDIALLRDLAKKCINIKNKSKSKGKGKSATMVNSIKSSGEVVLDPTTSMCIDTTVSIISGYYGQLDLIKFIENDVDPLLNSSSKNENENEKSGEIDSDNDDLEKSNSISKENDTNKENEESMEIEQEKIEIDKSTNLPTKNPLSSSTTVDRIKPVTSLMDSVTPVLEY